MPPPRSSIWLRRALPVTAVALLVGAALAGCGDGGNERPAAVAGNFGGTLEAARGQTVRWWMFGGDAKVNAYVDDTVAPAARKLGVTIERVPIG